MIPGITSVASLTARHRIPLNQVGRPAHITPARRLTEAGRNDDGDIVVMLDAHESFTQVAGDERSGPACSQRDHPHHGRRQHDHETHDVDGHVPLPGPAFGPDVQSEDRRVIGGVVDRDVPAL